MLNYILWRLLRIIPQVFLISILAFIIIQLPPGDYLTERINRLRATGVSLDQQEVENLTRQYGLDKPAYQRYFLWIGKIITKGDFGYSYSFSQPVNQIIGSRMGMTFFISFLAFVVCWSFAIPVGILVAVKQNSITHFLFTFLGFLGAAVSGLLFGSALLSGFSYNFWVRGRGCSPP